MVPAPGARYARLLQIDSKAGVILLCGSEVPGFEILAELAEIGCDPLVLSADLLAAEIRA